MNAMEAIPVLNRLLGLLCRSLPAYLADVKTLGHPEGERVRTALNRLVADQQMYARRVADAIARCGGRPDPGRFPTEFAAKNDLSLDFLLREIVACQNYDVASIAQCAGQLESESALHALAEEVLGNAKGHLDILLELVKQESK
jgi:hypothetical protein